MDKETISTGALHPLTKTRPYLFGSTVFLLSLIFVLFPGVYARYKADETKPKDQLITSQTIERSASVDAPVDGASSYGAALEKSLEAAFPFDQAWNSVDSKIGDKEKLRKDEGDLKWTAAEDTMHKAASWPQVGASLEMDHELQQDIDKLDGKIKETTDPQILKQSLAREVTYRVRLASDQGLFVPANVDQYGIRPSTCDRLSQNLLALQKSRSLYQRINFLKQISDLLKTESEEYGPKNASGNIAVSQAQDATLTRGAEADDDKALEIKSLDESIRSNQTSESDKPGLRKKRGKRILVALKEGLAHSVVPSAALVLAGAWLSGVLLALAVDKRKERAIASRPDIVAEPEQNQSEATESTAREASDISKSSANTVDKGGNRIPWFAILVALTGVAILISPAINPEPIARAIFSFTELGNHLSSNTAGTDEWLAIAKTPTPAFLPLAILASLFFYYASGKILPPREVPDKKDNRSDDAWKFLIPDAASAVAAGGLLLSGAIMAPALITSASPKSAISPTVAVAPGSQQSQPGLTQSEQEKDRQWAALLTTLTKAVNDSAQASSGLIGNVNTDRGNQASNLKDVRAASDALRKDLESFKKSMDTTWKNGQRSYQATNYVANRAASLAADSSGDSAAPDSGKDKDPISPQAEEQLDSIQTKFDKKDKEISQENRELAENALKKEASDDQELTEAANSGAITEKEYLSRLIAAKNWHDQQRKLLEAQRKAANDANAALAKSRGAIEALKVVGGSFQHVAGRLIDQVDEVSKKPKDSSPPGKKAQSGKPRGYPTRVFRIDSGAVVVGVGFHH